MTGDALRGILVPSKRRSYEIREKHHLSPQGRQGEGVYEPDREGSRSAASEAEWFSRGSDARQPEERHWDQPLGRPSECRRLPEDGVPASSGKARPRDRRNTEGRDLR